MIDSVAAATGPEPLWRVPRDVDVARLVARHATIRGLCAALEDCADRLPARDAIVEGLRVSGTLADSLRRDEAVRIIGTPSDSDAPRPLDTLLARIRHRHAADRLHAEDLRDALAAAARATGPVRSDTLGYMMRCLFDGCRRGIDFHEAVILLLAGDRLTPAARAVLGASLTEPVPPNPKRP